jgi:hypothetical protein
VHLIDLPAQICLILASCSLPIPLLEMSSNANDLLAYMKGSISDLISHKTILEFAYLDEHRDHDGIQLAEAFV